MNFTNISDAIREGTIEDVQNLVEKKGADVNARDSNGSSPIEVAIVNDNIAVAEFLISKGANVNARDSEGFALFHLMVTDKKYFEAAKFLVSKGADVNVKSDKGNTPLHKIEKNKDFVVAEFFISKGANVNAKNDVGSTPLHNMAVSGALEAAKFLVSKGADVNAKTSVNAKTPQALTPFDIAKLKKNTALVDYFSSIGGREAKVKSGGCYIATCVFGSYDCPEVWVLRRFRDNKLSNSCLGRLFIWIYYTVSPRIVQLFGNQKWFSKLWKPVLEKLVVKLQSNDKEKKGKC